MKEDELKVKSQEIEKLKGYMHVVKVENQHEMEILKSKLQELHEKLNKSDCLILIILIYELL